MKIKNILFWRGTNRKVPKYGSRYRKFELYSIRVIRRNYKEEEKRLQLLLKTTKTI